jgi:dienelactone hydrolase
MKLTAKQNHPLFYFKNCCMNYRFKSEVNIPVGNITLYGELTIPSSADAIVIFAHGSGSGKNSPRNQQVASHLNHHHIGTLLLDLLTEEEDRHYHNRFDIELLTKRLVGTTEWLHEQPDAKDCMIGYFGASTGAAAAIKAASYLPQIKAIVLRGGRPDLAMDNLPNVDAPTLLIVGRLDYEVLRLNKEAYVQMNCEKRLHVIEGATHLFEESGMMERVAELTIDWFEKHLQPVKI